MKKKKIQIGIDFDGVLAYNPFRLGRAPVTYLKRKLLGERKTHFYVPQTETERFVWRILHESSVFPAHGVSLLQQLVEHDLVEAHLVTARYSFLQDSLYHWLHKNKLENVLSSITINKKDEQPHLYKEVVIKARGFDYFIEDNLDIVTHLKKKQVSTDVLWIYNLIDRNNPYSHKFPHLHHALTFIKNEKKL